MINDTGADYFVSNDIVAIHMIIIDSLREEVIKKLNIDQPVFQLGFQKGRVLVLKKGSLVRCWIFKKGIF